MCSISCTSTKPSLPPSFIYFLAQMLLLNESVIWSNDTVNSNSCQKYENQELSSSETMTISSKRVTSQNSLQNVLRTPTLAGIYFRLNLVKECCRALFLSLGAPSSNYVRSGRLQTTSSRDPRWGTVLHNRSLVLFRCTRNDHVYERWRGDAFAFSSAAGLRCPKQNIR